MGTLSESDKAAIDAAYPGLWKIIADIVDAAIESDIYNHHFRPIDGGKYYSETGNITLYPDNTLYALDGGWISDVGGWNPGTQRDHFASAVGTAFENWDLLPERSASQPALAAAQNATTSLALHTTSQAATPDEIPSLESGNSQLAHNLGLALGLNAFKGTAMETLKQQFTSYLPGVIEGEYTLNGVVGAALQAEQDVWISARGNIVEIAKSALDAMKNANSWNGNMGESGELSGWWGVVAAVAGAAAAFFTGGAAVLLGGVSSAIGVLTSFDGVGGDDGKPGKLGAATPDDVLAKLNDAIGDLKKSIVTAEQKIADGCSQASIAVSVARIGDYGLPAIGALSDTDPGAYVSHQGEVEFNLQTLHTIGTTYLPAVADTLDDAGQSIATAGGSASFARSCPFGQNPFSDFQKVWKQLDDSVLDTSWKVRHVGTQLDLFVQDFRAVDSHNQADIDRINQRLGQVAAANGAGSGHRTDTGTYYYPDGTVIPH